jgi:hypothetical protein
MVDQSMVMGIDSFVNLLFFLHRLRVCIRNIFFEDTQGTDFLILNVLNELDQFVFIFLYLITITNS